MGFEKSFNKLCQTTKKVKQNMTFMPLSTEQLFATLSNEDDYAPAPQAAIYFSPSLSHEQRQKWQKAYPARIPMEGTKGWTELTSGYLAHEMATNFDLRRASWEEAQRLYFLSVMGDIRLCADFECEPADGFLRRELLPILQLRARAVTINHLPVEEFIARTSWMAADATAQGEAQIIPFPSRS